MCEALIHLDNTFISLSPNTYASLASPVETRSSVPLTLSLPVILLNFPFLLLLLPPSLTADYCLCLPSHLLPLLHCEQRGCRQLTKLVLHKIVQYINLPLSPSPPSSFSSHTCYQLCQPLTPPSRSSSHQEYCCSLMTFESR